MKIGLILTPDNRSKAYLQKILKNDIPIDEIIFMNDEIDPILVGETDDIEVGTVESFEHDDVNYAVYHLEPGFFCTQGNCNCEEKAPLSESEIEGEELECVGCGNTYSIVSGDCISDPELDGLKIFDISEEDGNIYLNIYPL